MRGLSYLLASFLSLLWAAVGPAQAPRRDGLGDPLPAQAVHRFGTSRFCTQTEVASLVVSHDGKLVAAADREGRVYLWHADTGKERLVTAAQSGKRVAISPDGAWLALGEDAPFELRNLRKDEAPRLPIGNRPRAFAFSPDSKTIAIAMTDETEIVRYDIAANDESRRYAGLEGMPTSVAFSLDGQLLAASSIVATEGEPPSVRVAVWDAAKGDKLRQIEQAGKTIANLRFLPDNKTLLGQVNARLVAWDARSGERNAKLERTVGSSYALDAAGKILATTDGPMIAEFASRKILHEFDTPALIRHLAMSGHGKLLAACPTRFESASPRLLLWDLFKGKERTLPDAHRHFVDAVAFSHDGKTIATASHLEGVARVWDANNAKLIHTLKLDSLAAKRSGGPRARRTLMDGLTFSIDRPELFVAGQRWSLTTGAPIPLQADDDFHFEQGNSRRAVLTPDGRRAASFLSGAGLLFWDPAAAKPIQRIAPADKQARSEWGSVVFSSDGKRAVTGQWYMPRNPDDDDVPDNDSISVWDIATGKLAASFRQRPDPIVRMMLSPDGETLAVIGYPARLELWHLPTGRLLREMFLGDLDELPASFAFPTLAFAPHGQWIAFTPEEGEIAFVETLTGKTIHKLKGHRGRITSLAFAPDSRRLLSGGRDTTALLWSVLPERRKLPADWNDADKLWLDLGGPPERAYPVVWALWAHPQKASEVLSKRLTPDAGATEKEIRAVIANLSSAKFKQRDQAIRRLKQIGTRTLPYLVEALKKAPDLETTRRIQELLRTVETSLTPETLRDLRGLQVLELLATPDAVRTLARIAAGDPAAAKTRVAQSALERIRLPAPPPGVGVP